MAKGSGKNARQAEFLYWKSLKVAGLSSFPACLCRRLVFNAAIATVKGLDRCRRASFLITISYRLRSGVASSSPSLQHGLSQPCLFRTSTVRLSTASLKAAANRWPYPTSTSWAELLHRSLLLELQEPVPGERPSFRQRLSDRPCHRFQSAMWNCQFQKPCPTQLPLTASLWCYWNSVVKSASRLISSLPTTNVGLPWVKMCNQTNNKKFSQNTRCLRLHKTEDKQRSFELLEWFPGKWCLLTLTLGYQSANWVPDRVAHWILHLESQIGSTTHSNCNLGMFILKASVLCHIDCMPKLSNLFIPHIWKVKDLNSLFRAREIFKPALNVSFKIIQPLCACLCPRAVMCTEILSAHHFSASHERVQINTGMTWTWNAEHRFEQTKFYSVSHWLQACQICRCT